jgi:hypothetical protein
VLFRDVSLVGLRRSRVVMKRDVIPDDMCCALIIFVYRKTDILNRCVKRFKVC